MQLDKDCEWWFRSGDEKEWREVRNWSMRAMVFILFFSIALFAKVATFHLIEKKSRLSYDRTVQRFRDGAISAKMKIIAKIDQWTSKRKSTLFVLDIPKVRKALLAQGKTRGTLDTLLRVLVFTRGSNTFVVYHSPKELQELYRVSPRLTRVLEKLMNKLTDYATGKR